MTSVHRCFKSVNFYLNLYTPKQPQYNGGVKQSNRIFREEFYAQPSLAHSIVELNLDLKKALKKHDYYRPHHALHLATLSSILIAIISEDFRCSEPIQSMQRMWRIIDKSDRMRPSLNE
jgi:hypothetical protein